MPKNNVMVGLILIAIFASWAWSYGPKGGPGSLATLAIKFKPSTLIENVNIIYAPLNYEIPRPPLYPIDYQFRYALVALNMDAGAGAGYRSPRFDLCLRCQRGALRIDLAVDLAIGSCLNSIGGCLPTILDLDRPIEFPSTSLHMLRLDMPSIDSKIRSQLTARRIFGMSKSALSCYDLLSGGPNCVFGVTGSHHCPIRCKAGGDEGEERNYHASMGADALPFSEISRFFARLCGAPLLTGIVCLLIWFGNCLWLGVCSARALFENRLVEAFTYCIYGSVGLIVGLLMIIEYSSVCGPI